MGIFCLSTEKTKKGSSTQRKEQQSVTERKLEVTVTQSRVSFLLNLELSAAKGKLGPTNCSVAITKIDFSQWR